jgi:hypothetical protein
MTMIVDAALRTFCVSVDTRCICARARRARCRQFHILEVELAPIADARRTGVPVFQMAKQLGNENGLPPV